ncbi:helix-turn-helix domain-containing protein [Cohnella yongneupensis]|uniref:Helix-turn-helix domain-containing protein n=1 Tax=Cohnella yongneupensis TaxID=425006 RepID=A0ABW0QXK1_9BACL
MNPTKADLILHPIRMRIILALMPEGNRTTQQLVERLSNVPQATLYRHLNTLLKAGLIHVAEERKVRGTTEKVYVLAKNAADITPEDMTETSPELHMELFMKFVASMIGSFGSYVGQDHYDLFADGISFRQHQFYLDDEEYREMLKDIRERMQRQVGNEPREGRRLRNLWNVVIPEVNGNEPDND